MRSQKRPPQPLQSVVQDLSCLQICKCPGTTPLFPRAVEQLDRAVGPRSGLLRAVCLASSQLFHPAPTLCRCCQNSNPIAGSRRWQKREKLLKDVALLQNVFLTVDLMPKRFNYLMLEPRPLVLLLKECLHPKTVLRVLNLQLVSRPFPVPSVELTALVWHVYSHPTPSLPCSPSLPLSLQLIQYKSPSLLNSRISYKNHSRQAFWGFVDLHKAFLMV